MGETGRSCQAGGSDTIPVVSKSHPLASAEFVRLEAVFSWQADDVTLL